MKRAFISLLSIAIGVMIVSVFNSYLTNHQTAQEVVVNKLTPAGLGTHDDPNARIEYERKRLIDPATKKIPDNIRANELDFARSFTNRAGYKSGTPWQPRGPYNVGGRTRALAFDINDENTILAGGVTGGLWRSTDGGSSFIKTTTPEQFHSVTCVAQDKKPGNTNVWYYGTGEYYGIVSAASFSSRASGNGIYKSINGGQSWQPLNSTVSNTPTTLYTNGDFDFVWNIVTDQTDASHDVVYAAVINGIFKSQDGGLTWDAVLGLDSNDTSLSHYTNIIITSSGVFYASISAGSSYSGFWRSTDGENWTEITPNSFPANNRRTVIAAVPADESKVYFLTETPNSGSLGHNLWYYSYLSGDGSGSGGAWENRTVNLPDYNCQEFYNFTFGSYDSQNSYDMAIAVNPDDEDVVFIGGTDVYRSTDGFTSSINHAWIGGYQCDTVTPSNYIYPNHHPDQHYFLFLPSDPNVLFTASDGGLHKTTNCLAANVQWQSLNNGYVTSQFYTVSIEHGDVSNNILIGGMQDNGTFFTNSQDANVPWSNVFYGDGAYAAIEEGRGNYYLSWQTGKLFKFEIENNGHVLGKTRIDPVGGTGYQFINPFILDPYDNNVMYLAAGRFLWRNNDLDSIPITNNEYNSISDGWERLNESNVGLGSPINPTEVSALSISASNNRLIYYGTTNGKLFRLDSLHTSNRIKTTLSSSDFPSGAYVSCITVNKEDASELMVSFSNYSVRSIFQSIDGGNNWNDISGNLEEYPDGSGDGPSVTWVEMLNLQDSLIYYAGTSIGLFSTTHLDGTNTIWQMEGPNTIGNVVINMIKTRAYDGLVAVATHGNGIFSKRMYDVTAIDELSKHDLLLEQNAPNPFSVSTYIKYSILEAQNVQLTIFSMDGRTINTLVEQKQQAGTYTVKWDARDQYGNKVIPGAYVYQLQAGGYVVANKLLVNP